MNAIKRYYKIFLTILGLLTGLSTVSVAAQYEVVEIPPFESYTESRAFGINNEGKVVGRFFNYNAGTNEEENKTAFIWDSVTGGTQILNSLYGQSSARVINDLGIVAGYSYNAYGYQRAVRWNNTGDIRDIGTFTNTNETPRHESVSYGINNQNHIVGYADILKDDDDYYNPLFHAFLYNDALGTKKDLGTLNNSTDDLSVYYKQGFSNAYDINNQEQTVGVANTYGWGLDAFIYDETNGMRGLSKDPSYVSNEWQAVAINDNGVIGGHVIVSEQSLPYYWENPSSNPISLTMPDEFPYGQIYSINESGQMVGIMWNGSNVEHAFMFDPINGVVDLNTLMAPDSGWILQNSREINNLGQIVGSGQLNGEIRGFILKSAIVPEPMSFLLYGLGGISMGIFKRIKRRKRA